MRAQEIAKCQNVIPVCQVRCDCHGQEAPTCLATVRGGGSASIKPPEGGIGTEGLVGVAYLDSPVSVVQLRSLVKRRDMIKFGQHNFTAGNRLEDFGPYPELEFFTNLDFVQSSWGGKQTYT